MAADFTEQVQAEVERIRALEIDEQPEAWARLRDVLETTLMSVDSGTTEPDQSTN
jgi:hypothetical protein